MRPYEPKSKAGKRVVNSLNEKLRETDIDVPDTEPKKSYAELAEELAENLDAS